MIGEEFAENSKPSAKDYLKTFKRVHKDLKVMTIGPNAHGLFFKSLERLE